MNYQEQLNDLRSKTVILPETFEKYGLNVDAVGFSSIEKNSFTILIEVVARTRSGLKEDVEIRVNMYDESGQIITSDYACVEAEEFDGINTYSLFPDETGLLERVQKIRIYATR